MKGNPLACSSTCPTQDHESYGQCLRSKRLTVADPQAHKHNQRVYAQCDAYADARRAGLQPETVFKKDVDFAWKETERTGTPYRADKRAALPTVGK
jgi:hypothetical protein